MKETLYPRIIVAGMKGGSGKTMLSLGLIGALRKRGLSIISYKKGPDYIDAGWLSSASGKPCYNLDPFLITKEKILSSFLQHFGSADCAVIEGNRGLYDGMDSKGTYSTAELAKTLHAPVILVLDCTKATRTIAALLLGMQKFDRKVPIRGVVLNQIAGTRHEAIIKEAIEKYCRIPVLGSIPKLGDSFLSERHMGLTPFQEHPEVNKTINRAAEIIAEHIDLERILSIANSAKPLIVSKTRGKKEGNDLQQIKSPLPLKIGIILDSAFQFYYPENFEEIEKRGAELVDINAMTMKAVPDIDALYIGGGFPETNAVALAANTPFRRSLKSAVEKGLPVYAECGGLMYLGKTLVVSGKNYPMTGIFPIRFSVEKKPQAHGYTIVKVTQPNPFFEQGVILKGHEFHYSKVIESHNGKALKFCLSMERGQGILEKMDGLCHKNVFATYTHLHALGAPEWVDGVIRQAAAFRKTADAKR